MNRTMIREYIYFVDDNPNGTSGMTEEEIIRCKDCKFCEKHEDYSPTPIEPPWCYCKNPWVMRETGFNDFCSFGERIESEE